MNKVSCDNIFKIGFRLDGGHLLGMGHAVRCTAIARELHKRISVKILFVINKSPELISFIEKGGFSAITYGHNETDEVYKIFSQYEPDVIFNDLPHSSAEYMKKIKNLCPSINYDDGGGGADMRIT